MKTTLKRGYNVDEVIEIMDSKTILIFDDTISSIVTLQDIVESFTATDPTFAGIHCILSDRANDATYKVNTYSKSLLCVIFDLNMRAGKLAGWHWFVENFLNKGGNRKDIAYNSLIISGHLGGIKTWKNELESRIESAQLQEESDRTKEELDLLLRIEKIDKNDPQQTEKIHSHIKKLLKLSVC